MSHSALAARYAKAFMSTMAEKSKVEQGLEGLQSLAAIFNMEDAAKVLRSPIMPDELKADLLKYAANKVKEAETLEHFVVILLQSKRINLIPEITQHYRALVLASKNISEGQIISAQPLEVSVIDQVRVELEKKLNTKLELTNHVNPSLLGGFKVLVGNKLIDMSVKTQLEQLTASAVQ